MEEVLEKFIEKIRKDGLLIPIYKEDNDATFDNKYKVYNEISLQHELGKFLEKKGYNVFFEKNMYNSKKEEKKDWVKKEVDIVAIDNNTSKKYAIELKFAQSKNGQFPVGMYQFVKDICFMEQVLEKKEYTATFNLIIVNDKKYFSTEYSNKDKYYKIFRHDENEFNIPKKLDKKDYFKPTGKEEGEKFSLKTSYKTNWKKIINNDCKEYADYRYLLISHIK